MKVGLFSRIGPPLPTAPVHDRVAVGIFARPFPSLSRHRAEIPAPATQVLGPALHVDQDAVLAPLVQEVPTEERLNNEVTSAEIRDVLQANAKALRHGAEPTALGYSADAWAAIVERAAEKYPTKPPEKIASEERQRDAARRQRELALALFGAVKQEVWRGSHSKREATRLIAHVFAVAFDRSEGQAFRDVTKLRNEFLRSHPATEN